MSTSNHIGQTAASSPFRNVEGWRVNDQVTPDQLQIPAGIPLVANLFRILLFLQDERLLLSGRNVLALGLVVFEGFDGLGSDSGGHGAKGARL